MPPVTKTPRTRQPHYIRAWRRHRGMTQIEAAEAAGISNAQLSRIERGAQPYNQDILELLAEALGVRPADLLAVDPGR